MTDTLRVTTEGIQFIGHCKCGSTHKFNKKHKLIYQEQKQIIPSYKCDICSSEYTEFYVDYPKKKIKRNRQILLSALISCSIAFGIWVFANIDEWKGEPTFFDTGNVNDMTEQQKDGYFNWLFEKENKD
jgi:hypothetical protein